MTCSATEILPKDAQKLEGRRLWWVLCALVLAGALPYLRSLGFAFVYDDNVQVLANPAIQSWSSLPAYFAKPIAFYTSTNSASYYRPLFLVWMRANYTLWGTDPFGWHLTNVLLHLAATWLAFCVLRQYFRSIWWAAAGGLIFAVHPVHTESVAWVSGCTDALMAGGLLGSLYLWLDGRKSGSRARQAGSLACFAVALLCKETAVALPGLVFVHALVGIPADVKPGDTRQDRIKDALIQTGPYLGVTALYLVVRWFVLQGTAGTHHWVSRTEALLTIPSLLMFYASHLVWPSRLSLFYDIPVVSHVSDRLFWMPLLALVAIAAVACVWFLRSRDARAPVAVSWFVLPLVPVLYIRLFSQDDFAHDRYLYLPVLAVSMLVGLVGEFLEQRSASANRALMPTAVIGLVVILLGANTAPQISPWRNNLLLYCNAVETAPGNAMARNNLATQYAAQGRYADAAELLVPAVQTRPEMWLANYNFGYVNYQLGNLGVAEDFLRRAIRIDPNDADEHVYLGAAYFKQGRLEEAGEQVRRGVAIKMDGKGYHLTLALIELRRGNIATAREQLEEEAKFHPENKNTIAQLEAMYPQLATAP